MLHYADVGPHPWMLVTLHRNHHLRLGKGLDDRLVRGHLRLVPRRVVAGHVMYVVVCRIRVEDLERLPGHDPQNARTIAATFLIENHGIAGNRKGALRQTFLHIDEDVGQLAALQRHHFRRLRFRRTTRIGAHVQRAHLLRHAYIGHNARDRARRGHIHGNGCGLGRSG